MNLLPVLQRDDPRQHLCSICPVPGACCKGFMLFIGHEPVIEDDAELVLEENKLPFKVQGFDEHGQLLFSCPRLGEDGRCTIYEERPDLCRSFVPTSSPLCKFPLQSIAK